jgi:hypothetical protein
MHPSLRRNNNRQGDMVDLISGRPRAVPFCFCAQRQQVFCIGCIYTPAPFFSLSSPNEERAGERELFPFGAGVKLRPFASAVRDPG